VLDDIGSLRQLNASTAQQPAMLFKPTDALAIVQGGDNGTPWQKDEPQAENAPVGAVIDYYLKSPASGPVVIDILDPAAKWCGVTRATHPRRRPRRLKRSPRYGCAAHSRSDVSGHASMDVGSPRNTSGRCSRWWWRWGGFGRQQPMLTGSFTVRLTVDGQTLTQPLMVKPDPRTK
jgi:hypothetical protein